MIAELSHYALVLAFALSLVQATVPIWGAAKNDASLMGVAAPVSLASFLFVGLSFAGLTALYIASDFSVINVYENSHSAKPLIYKISGVWGNHEGSMLLWVLVLVLFLRARCGVRRRICPSGCAPMCWACRG
jgi:cytochrome c-type biogenesis protein CcmF